MSAGTDGRRSAAWQLAIGATGLSLALGSSVLLPGIAAAAEDSNWAAPQITGTESCDSLVLLTFDPVEYSGTDTLEYWVQTAPAPSTGDPAPEPTPTEPAPTETSPEPEPEPTPTETSTEPEATPTETTTESTPTETSTEPEPTPTETTTESTPTETTTEASTDPTAPALAAAASGEEWSLLDVRSFEGVLMAKVGPLTADEGYSIVIEARAGGSDSLDSEPVSVLVSDVACEGGAPVEEPQPETPVEEPVTEKPVEEPVTEAPVEEPVAEKPVDVPVTPVPDNGGTPVVKPVVPQAVPSTPFKLVTDQGADTKLVVGEKLRVTGEGFAPNTLVSVIIYSEPRVLTTVYTDANGSFSVEVEIPEDLPAGDHSLVASGTDADGNERFVRLDVTVDPAGAVTVNNASADDSLAYTGATPVVPMLLGGGALLGGALLLLVTRRRAGAQV